MISQSASSTAATKAKLREAKRKPNAIAEPSTGKSSGAGLNAKWYCWLISARSPSKTPVPSSSTASPVRTSPSGPLRSQYPPLRQAISSAIPTISFGSFPISSQFCEITSTNPRKTSAAPRTARIVISLCLRPWPAAASSNSRSSCR